MIELSTRRLFAWRMYGLAFTLAATCGAALADQRPNIILCMGDDHGWDETAYNGHPHLRTPVLDEMAAAGLRVDRFYSASPVCSPTRGSVITGRHPNRYGTFAPNWSIRPEEVSIAQILGKAGYTCGQFGKWHSICFWNYDTRHETESGFEPYLDAKDQEGTTPLVKQMNGRLTRNFRSLHHPRITAQDFVGPRSILDHDYKLVVDGQPGSQPTRELFDLRHDPAETTNLIDTKPAVAKKLEQQLRAWQQSVLNSLTGADYR